MSRYVFFCLFVIGAVSGSFAGPAWAASFGIVTIELGDHSAVTEEKTAELLQERITEYSSAAVELRSGGTTFAPAGGELLVLLGLPEHHARIAQYMEAERIKPFTDIDPGPEGFLVRSKPVGEGMVILAVGVEPRGVLYAAGEILRQVTYNDGTVGFPEGVEVRRSPRFEVRGTQFDQGHTMLQLTGAREWTFEEKRRVILDYALAGANTMEVDLGLKPSDPIYQLFKDFNLKMLIHYGPNIGRGDAPDEWKAKEGIGRKNYFCPSVPAARAALLERCEKNFRDSVSFDYVRFFSGDGGGCECEKCKPYGGTYIRLCADMADIIHKYHPDTEIFCTNEKTDNAGDIAIWEYLREEPRTWLRAFCMGCGSDAMGWQPGRRQDHRMDLFKYPGFGPYSRYPLEVVHNLPPLQDLVYFNELTHWWYSELGYVRFPPAPDANGDVPPAVGSWIYDRHPDYYLIQVYHRRTFFAWPRYYRKVFDDLMRFSIGDVTHSSGHHDHFNQWMWQRLMWLPRASVEEIVDSYCRTWFGPEAAPEMAKALFLLEQNLGGDAPHNPGIDEYYRLVKAAGEKMPERFMRGNWLWRQYMQKGALDRYIRLDAQQQLGLQKRIEERATEALAGGDLDAAIKDGLSWLGALGETGTMAALRAEAGRLGDESDALFGVRSEGFFNLEHDYIGLGWTKETLEKARAADADEKRLLLQRIADYANPGEGGFYDNAGEPDGAPHMVYGTIYDHGQQLWEGAISEANRPSQRTMAFTAHEAQGVTFEYDGLDPAAEYRVRFSLLRPVFEEFCAYLMNQKSESIYADDIPLAENLEVPEHKAETVEFDIPKEATADGKLIIRFMKAPDVAVGPWVDVSIWRNNGGWGTLVSEVWLEKKGV